MGLLFESMQKVRLHQEMKRNFIIDRLREKMITHSQTGTPIEELDYEDLKYELVLASFKDIDRESESGKWF